MTLEPGSRLAHYEVTTLIGEGGMGQVYRARDTKLERDVALKVLPQAVTDDPDRLARLRREARTVASLNHPNVVTIFALEEADDVHFLVMELVEGRTLKDVVPVEGLPFHELLRLAEPLVEAVGAAHRRGIVHRDLKPANIMVDGDGKLTVLDFGLAKSQPRELDDDTAANDELTKPQQVFGTPHYMSPEQAERKPLDPRSDVFSLGIVLFEMAAGMRPFSGDSTLGVVSSILKDDPLPLAQVRPDLPTGLGRIIERCLEKAPGGRYQSALELRDDLVRLRDPSMGLSTVDEDDRVVAGAGGSRTTESTETTAAGRGRGRWLVAAVGLAVLVVGVGVFVSRGSSAPPVDTGAAPRATFAQLTHDPGAELFPSLSPDGEWVAYAGEDGDDRDIFLQRVDGQDSLNLTDDSTDDDEQPAFSPDGERIAFRSERAGGGIFVMERTGQEARRVTTAGFNPAWSPDGTQLAYTTTRAGLRPANLIGRSDLMVVDVEGGASRRIHEGDAILPHWSPDGRRIAFSERLGEGAEGRANVMVVAAEGGRAVEVTADANQNWNPVWSPDGRHLYFLSDRGGSQNLWRVPVDPETGRRSGEPQAITSPASFAAHLSIAADGRHVAYSSVRETQNIQRLTFDPDTAAVVAEPAAVTTGTRFWSSPDPSPDGAWVTFYGQPEGDIYVAPADGSAPPLQLTDDDAVDRVPRWSPDGDWIAMFSDRSEALQIWKIRADGSELQQVTRPESGGTVVAWSPDASRMAVAPGVGLGTVEARAAIIDAGPATAERDRDVLPPFSTRDSGFVPNAWSADGAWIVGQNSLSTLGITRYSPETRTYEPLADFGEWPVWFPAGRRALFVSRGREFHVVDVETGETSLAFDVVRDTLGPPRLSRDGRHAYFSRRVTEADIWLATLE